jgi:D-beta-D-heptose 7-phosphate kinase/D-beta-D-heptose 1-phosphate adenosyltransferase
MDVDMMTKKIAVSGGFDPLHVGHVRMILAAAELGDVIVIANSDAWLKRKKGYVFMPWEERSEILSAIKGVHCVVEAKDYDRTVCETLSDLSDTIGLDYFANGGDRKKNNTPEINTCKRLDIKMIWNCGGEKMQSSSELVDRQKNIVK